MAPAPLPLPTRWVVGLLGVKLLCALGYAYLYFHLRPATSDVWGYYDQSRQLAGMIHTPADFFNYALPTHGSWSFWMHYNAWNNLKENVYVVLLLVMNLLTGGNVYADTVLFAVLTFTGWLRLIRLFRALYPGRAHVWYALPFLLPTFLFCYSGLHSDGLIFALLGWFAWDAYRLFVSVAPHSEGDAAPLRPAEGTAPRRPPVWRFVLICLLFACFKAFFLVLLLLLVLAWRLRRPYGWLFLTVAGALLLAVTIPEQVSRQQDYLALHELRPESATTAQPLTAGSYLSHLPGAVWTGLFRPAPWEGSKYLVSALEVWLLWLLLMYGFTRRVRRSFFEASWAWLTVMFCLLIGYTIPVMGAVIRYRALLFPLVLGLCLLPLVRPRKAL